MTCPSCSAANAPGRRFCGWCGRRVRFPCQRCGFENEQADAFCGGCGEPTAAAHLARSPDPAIALRSAARPPALGEGEMEELLRQQPASPPLSPSGLPQQVSQDDLDRLFVGGS